jgi:hypothetical protein
MIAEGQNEGGDQNDAGKGRFEGQDIRELRTYFEGKFRAVKRQVSLDELLHDRADRRWTEWRVYSIKYSISSEVGIDSSTQMRGDHHTIITASNLEMTIVTTLTMMTISIIRLGLVFVDLLRLMLGRLLYRIIWTLLVRDSLLFDLLSISSRKRLEVLGRIQLLLLHLVRRRLPLNQTQAISSLLIKLVLLYENYRLDTKVWVNQSRTNRSRINRPKQHQLQQQLLRIQIPNTFIRSTS